MASNGDVNSVVRTADAGSLESKKYYMARRTVLEMLRDRGYAVSGDDLSLSLSDFRAVYGQKPDLQLLRICAARLSNLNRKILVIFCGTAEIRKQAMIDILALIANRESLDRVILVLQSKINSHAKKVIDEFPVKVDTFHITDLLVNITKHVLQPKYEILSAEEKQKLLNKYDIQNKQLPVMLETDAIAKYYGLEKGQVVKVTHGGSLTDSIINYRCIA